MPADSRPRVIALMGPTASGKTAAALALAARLPAEVISVDSALVYRGLDIGSAKPSAAERAAVPHHLIDIREPWAPYSAAEFAREASGLVAEIHARGRTPLLVGGTGLYFRALLDGLSPMPESDPGLRAALVAECAERGAPAMHAELAAVDPASAARIRPGDSQRVLRALEVFRLSGRPLSEWQAAAAPPRRPFCVLKIALAPPDRSLLHRRIADRFAAMLEAGFLDEVRRLRADPRFDPELPAMRAVGYRQALAHLDGETDLAGFLAAGIAATRQLAKRQLTWLRSEADLFWVDPVDETRLQRLVDGFL
ncbi:tRNA (adenosine(37)-N6)-dimethylallyltransferase MiaA [Pseudomarimonas salicorniae]|uniref:tRNA dimethylallyltransferase n=1 Tax=Pseudomarimonas salicorniae TaxID=2933270 RepID=A0ABT0GDJ4_9GAMM|nr:tRNA (adenosine(37)-N6)-dimethylallyltransferase MiaA [Lysobacter sp. CAU 1642]MCK7592615.1 tRNA (adenosine(37)-N6)-dimethylallyltransferase MiaA [Lysobacter sp. CAU 1642]